MPREQDKSAPNHFLPRIDKFIEDGGWSEKEGDQLWFVLDVDRWKREELERLRITCEQHTNWHLAISNPCFEVWILYHILPFVLDNGETCADLKRLLHTAIEGGYKVETIAPLIEPAATNAGKTDGNAQGYFPDRMKTKLYRMAEEMVGVLGANWNKG